jgi:UDPglucose 6-dehydrogenase
MWKTSARGSVRTVRIGPAFLRAGCGYGGSCFPKDVSALAHISRAVGHENLFVNAIQKVNESEEAFRRQDRANWAGLSPGEDRGVGTGVQGRHGRHPRIAALDVIRYLLEKGAIVTATDPKAMENMKQVFKDERRRGATIR